jgi:hypothetical protein
MILIKNKNICVVKILISVQVPKSIVFYNINIIKDYR